MAFDFKKSLIKVQGGQTYLPVSARIVWFRQEHPDWGIHTEPVEINHEKQYAVFRATIYNADGKLMATGTKKEDVKGFGDFMEKAETGAVGRALALCGFGTQFSPDLDEVGRGRFADSPYPVGGNRPGGGQNGGQNGGGGGSRYGNPPPQSGQNNGGQNSGNQNGDGARPAPPREAAERPAANRDGGGTQTRQEAPRPAPPRADAPRDDAPRPTTAVADDAGEDDIEALIGGAGLTDATEDDPFGDDAPAAPKAAAKAAPVRAEAPAAGAVPSGMPECVGCGKALTKAQQELSVRNYGEALCPGCQRDKTRRPALSER